MPFIENGVKAPFKKMQSNTAYDYYKVDCLIGNKTPLEKQEYQKIINDVQKRARSKLKSIVKRAEKYKCYVL